MTRKLSLEVITNSTPAEGAPATRDPAQWHQAVGVARQACARIFRDGGTALDAVRAFGLDVSSGGVADWSRAVTLIADNLCAPRLRRAA